MSDRLIPSLAKPATPRRVWPVGALCRAVADALEARFNPVSVRGEISGFTRAASGHCYFTLKDPTGQIRCAMFRRAASALTALPRDGDEVEVQGRLDVYDARGDLQLIVETLARAGQGSLFEEFLRRKARLEAEGLFDPARKRPLPVMPRGIGVVTSLGAAALHDAATALRRRLPHVPVVVAAASVQGAQAPGELVAALQALYDRAASLSLDVILLVRGGGSLEDLWAFNDEALARMIVRSPVPLVCGVGHETDFTIADFCADLRAPTPTAAAEMAAQPRDVWLGALTLLQERLQSAAWRRLDGAAQRLDSVSQRLGRPSSRAARQQQQLQGQAHRLQHALILRLQRQRHELSACADTARRALDRALDHRTRRLDQAALRLEAMNPREVLQRGYALLTTPHGEVITRAADTRAGQALQATLADGKVDLTVATSSSVHA